MWKGIEGIYFIENIFTAIGWQHPTVRFAQLVKIHSRGGKQFRLVVKKGRMKKNRKEDKKIKQNHKKRTKGEGKKEK